MLSRRGARRARLRMTRNLSGVIARVAWLLLATLAGAGFAFLSLETLGVALVLSRPSLRAGFATAHHRVLGWIRRRHRLLRVFHRRLRERRPCELGRTRVHGLLRVRGPRDA